MRTVHDRTHSSGNFSDVPPHTSQPFCVLGTHLLFALAKQRSLVSSQIRADLGAGAWWEGDHMLLVVISGLILSLRRVWLPMAP